MSSDAPSLPEPLPRSPEPPPLPPLRLPEFPRDSSREFPFVPPIFAWSVAIADFWFCVIRGIIGLVALASLVMTTEQSLKAQRKIGTRRTVPDVSKLTDQPRFMGNVASATAIGIGVV